MTVSKKDAKTGRMLFSEVYDPTRWLPPREIERRIARNLEIERTYQASRRAAAGFIGAIVGFILGYLTWAIWPVSGLIYRLFTECFL